MKVFVVPIGVERYQLYVELPREPPVPDAPVEPVEPPTPPEAPVPLPPPAFGPVVEAPPSLPAKNASQSVIQLTASTAPATINDALRAGLTARA